MDEYNVLKQIGKGSYGEVWLAQSKTDRKRYVIKQMTLKNVSKRENKAAQLEVKLLASLHHPNIVSYKESFIDPGFSIYIVMGFCEGGDMYHYIRGRQGVPIDENLVIEWFLQITMALKYIHERNILHRDLKTQNIFLTKSKIIKLGDFGIARVLDSTCQMATTLIGTPYYMSPEIFTNKPYNHKSDVWALGCCLYEMTSLKHAFNARDMNSLMYKILKGKPPPMPKNFNPDLLALMRSMLNHDPDQRPSVPAILNSLFIRKKIAVFLNETKESLKVPEIQIKRSNRVKKHIPVTKQSKNNFGKFVPENKSECTDRSVKQEELHQDIKPNISVTNSNSASKGENSPLCSNQNDNLHAKSNNKRIVTKVDSKSQINTGNGQIFVNEEHTNDLPITPQVSNASLDFCDKTAVISNTAIKESYNNVARARRRQNALNMKPSDNIHISKRQVATAKDQEIYKDIKISVDQKHCGSSSKSNNLKCYNNSGTPRPLPSLPQKIIKSDKKKQEEKNNIELIQKEVERNKLGRSDSDGATETKILKEKECILPPSYRQCNKSARQRRREKVKCEITADDITKRPKSVPVSNSDTNLVKLSIDNEGKSSEIIELITALNDTLNPPDLGIDKKEVQGKDVLAKSICIEDRTTTLRKDCLIGVGCGILKEAFVILDSSENEAKQQELLTELLGDKFDEFIGKIWQLKFCENFLK